MLSVCASRSGAVTGVTHNSPLLTPALCAMRIAQMKAHAQELATFAFEIDVVQGQLTLSRMTHSLWAVLGWSLPIETWETARAPTSKLMEVTACSHQPYMQHSRSSWAVATISTALLVLVSPANCGLWSALTSIGRCASDQLLAALAGQSLRGDSAAHLAVSETGLHSQGHT